MGSLLPSGLLPSLVIAPSPASQHPPVWPGPSLPTCLLTCGVWWNGGGAEKMKVLLCAGTVVFSSIYFSH